MSETNFDMDALLEGKLDDLADVPEFKNFPNGAHIATIKFKRETINKHPCMKVTLIGQSTEELANPNDDKPIEKGAESGVLYMFDNELGQGKFKELMKPFADALGADKSLGTLVAEAEGATVLVVTTQRANKEKTKMYMDIQSLALV